MSPWRLSSLNLEGDDQNLEEDLVRQKKKLSGGGMRKMVSKKNSLAVNCS